MTTPADAFAALRDAERSGDLARVADDLGLALVVVFGDEHAHRGALAYVRRASAPVSLGPTFPAWTRAPPLARALAVALVAPVALGSASPRTPTHTREQHEQHARWRRVL